MTRAPQSWNRIPQVQPARLVTLDQPRLPILKGADDSFTVFGNGRSYGDVCLTAHGTLLTTRNLDRFIHFDPQTGVLACQAGITLDEILALIVPQGWFLPVTPGTRYATLGGAIANDVHGKNHHAAGSFGHHVLRLELVRSDGTRMLCTPEHNADWLRATIGGLGLTGLIASAAIQLVRIQTPWMTVMSQRFANLDAFWQLNRQVEQAWPYVVAWIDCLAHGKQRGRGVMYAGSHAPAQEQLPVFRERARTVPVESPVSLVNGLSLRAFNQLYYRKPTQPGGALCHYIPYFYPLDAIGNWNRIYGRGGFYQYQCVLPPAHAEAGTSALLDAIARSGQGSFLAVLKTFGDKPAAGMLSFPRQGATLALDFPARGDKTLKLFETLDAIVMEAGGALYPAKDARMSGEMFRQGFPEWEAFGRYIDPKFTSHFRERVTQ